MALKLRTKFVPFANFIGLHIFVATLRREHSRPYCHVSRGNDGALLTTAAPSLGRIRDIIE